MREIWESDGYLNNTTLSRAYENDDSNKNTYLKKYYIYDNFVYLSVCLFPLSFESIASTPLTRAAVSIRGDFAPHRT